MAGVGQEEASGFEVALAVVPQWACVERDEQVEVGLRQAKCGGVVGVQEIHIGLDAGAGAIPQFGDGEFVTGEVACGAAVGVDVGNRGDRRRGRDVEIAARIQCLRRRPGRCEGCEQPGSVSDALPVGRPRGTRQRALSLRRRVNAISSGRSTGSPLPNFAPARTSATRCGALTARQRDRVAPISLSSRSPESEIALSTRRAFPTSVGAPV